MDSSKISVAISQYADKIPQEKTVLLKNKLEQADDSALENLAMTKLHNPIIILIMSIFLGGIGVDRFMIGDVGLGICKLLFGGFTLGIWPLVDIFFSYKKAKEINFNRLMTVI